MPSVNRIGDANNAGGVVTATAQTTVYANGQPIAVDGSSVSGHLPFSPPHDAPVTASGSSTVTINGLPINREGDADSCGHSRLVGSPDVYVGG